MEPVFLKNTYKILWDRLQGQHFGNPAQSRGLGFPRASKILFSVVMSPWSRVFDEYLLNGWIPRVIGHMAKRTHLLSGTPHTASPLVYEPTDVRPKHALAVRRTVSCRTVRCYNTNHPSTKPSPDLAPLRETCRIVCF